MDAVHGGPHVVPEGVLVRGGVPELGQIAGQERLEIGSLSTSTPSLSKMTRS